jgi:hypothetical protein
MCTIVLVFGTPRWLVGLTCEGHALVLLPLLDGLGALDEDDEVLALALVVALGLGGVSAHVGCCGGWLVWIGSV